MLDEQTIQTARQTDLVQFLGRYSELRRVANDEYEGPCPKCGGTDRLHVKPDGWFCRQCKPLDDRHGWHSAIDFVMWRQGLRFVDAVNYLVGVPVTAQERTAVQRQARKRPSTSVNVWRQGAAEGKLKRAQRHLFTDGRDARGQDYLLDRAIQPGTWQAFGLGYATHYNPDSRSEAPAIAIPWYRGGKLTAIRYRFLAPVSQKIVSERGSKFGGLLFGGQALHGQDVDRSTVDCVLCEGEINAMSIWQVQHEASLDVLSLGSESARITDAMIAHLRRYRRVIVWMDKPDVVDAVMRQVPNVYGISSPQGQDANDLLVAGKLSLFLAKARLRTFTDADGRAVILRNLENLMRNPNCWRANVAQFVEKELHRE